MTKLSLESFVEATPDHACRGGRPHGERRWSKREGVTETSTAPSAPAGADAGSAPTPFHDLQQFVALPRLGGFRDGPRRVAPGDHRRRAEPDGKRFSTSLWEVDPGGQRPPRRLTRSAPGEAHPAFARTAGCCSSSPPAGRGGQAGRGLRGPRGAVAASRGGRGAPGRPRRGGDVGVVAVARESDTWPSRRRRCRRGHGRGRREAPAGAQGRRSDGDPARESPGPVLGPRPRAGRVARPVLRARPGRRRTADRRAGPDSGRGRQASAKASPSPPTAARSPSSGASTTGAPRTTVLARVIDTASGERRILSTDGLWISDPTFSPDGRSLAYLQETGDCDRAAATHAARARPRRRRGQGGAASGHDRLAEPPGVLPRRCVPLLPRRRRRPRAGLPPRSRQRSRRPAHGRRLVHRPGRQSGRERPVRAPVGRRLAADPGAARPDAAGPGGRHPARPAPAPDVPGTITEVERDRRGRQRRCVPGWCCPRRPATDAPAPLLLWIHGGPLEQLERLDLAVEPVAAGGARVRGPAAGSGAVDRLRPSTFIARLGQLGRPRRTPTSWRSPTPPRRGPTSTRPAPPRWADRSAATWPTGSPGTPTGSARSSRTPACGPSTSSPDDRRLRPTGTRS